MPSTTTTSVTLPSILDLLGPGAQSSASAKELPSFDELLRPAPPARFDRAAPEPKYHTPHDPVSPPSATIDSTDAAQYQVPADSAIEETDQIEAEIDDEGPRQQDSEQSTSEGGLLVESLAGLAAVASAISAADPAAVAEETDEMAEQLVGECRLDVAKPKQAATAIPTIPTVVIGEDATGNDSTAAAAAATESSNDQNPEAAQQNQVAATDLQTAITETAVLDASADESSGLKTDAIDSAIESAADLRGRDGENSPDNEAASIELAVETEKAPLSTQTAAETVNQVNSAPAASQFTSTDSTSAAIGAPTALGSSSALQNRLPGDVLVQSAGVSNRRGTVAIDSARLLTRVARAFAAAQEGDGEIRLRLSPPELGSLRLEVRIQDGALVAHLQTETALRHVRRSS